MLSNETDAQAQRTATVVVERTTNIDLDVWELAGGRCWFYPRYSPRNKLINAPVDEGWRLQNYPRINPGGVVNGTDYSTNIHPGTVVAIFGTNFRQPDKVIVRQSQRLWEIQFGSPWWYDSPQQINASLPVTCNPGGRRWPCGPPTVWSR